MTAKEYLSQARNLDLEIDAMNMQLVALNALATRSTSTLQDVMVCHSRDVHDRESIYASLIDLNREIDREVDRLVDLKREIMHVIREVEDPVLRNLLNLRYLCYKSWKEIATAMHCTKSNVMKYHRQALAAVHVPPSAQD